MLHALVVFATEAAEEGSSHVPFYVFGVLLAAWAVAVSLMGIRRADSFPPRASTRSGVIAVTLLLVVGTATTAVITA
jgi:hypothetical protein